MRIRSVRAHPFGALRDDELHFGPGVTVVSGPNESGKSTWHVAVTTALTGRRKRRATRADKEFVDRHAPWLHDGFAVSAVVELDSGQTVRVVRDLYRGTAHAFDDSTGADLTATFGGDGTVDLARVVGLDRSTLPLVAAVGQAEVLELIAAAGRDDGAALKAFLQQAATSRAEADVTAEHALKKLDKFVTDRLGSDRSNSTKPLRSAIDAAVVAEDRRLAAVAAWEQHRRAEADQHALDAQVQDMRKRVAARRLSQARSELLQAENRLNEVTALSAGAPAHRESPPDSVLIAEVRNALAAHDAATIAETGHPSSQLAQVTQELGQARSELSALPDMPAGPTAVDPQLVSLAQEIRAAEARQSALADDPPTAEAAPTVGHYSAGELRELAHEFERPTMPEPVKLLARQNALAEREARARQQSPVGRWLVALGAVLGVVGALLWAIGRGGQGLVGDGGIAAVASVALLLFVVGSVSVVRHRRQLAALVDLSTSSQAELQAAVLAHEQSVRRRSEAVSNIRLVGLDPAPAQLRATADQLDRSIDDSRRTAHWQAELERRTQVSEELCRSATALLSEAGVRSTGEPNPAHVLGLIESHRSQVVANERNAERAKQAPALTARVASLASSMAALSDAEQREQVRTDELRRLASLADISSGAPSQVIADALRAWLRSTEAAVEEFNRDTATVARLDGMLQGATVGELTEQVERLRSNVAELSIGHDRAATTVERSASDVESLARAEVQLAEMERRLSSVQGGVAAAALQLDDVSAVTEARDRAVAERDRLLKLRDLVDQTRQYLLRARDEVHRDIAPKLADATKDRLARVSGGRYKEVRVNPDDLAVQVQLDDGTWRSADRLSHGTCEQIYLLLRAAIAEVIAPSAESCPLILDDVTVHADVDRTSAVLDVLDDLSNDRQVIVFSQEQAVRDWALANGASIIDLPGV